MIKKGKKGGKVLASGGYGCVFSPALLCSNTKKRRKNHISKLMASKFALQEYKEISEIKTSLQHIKHYNNYFLLKDITLCKPAKLTSQDLQQFTKKCTALPKDGISPSNINDNIDKLMALTMPNAGVPIDDYLVEKKNFASIFNVSVKLIELLKKGIVPMNNKNVYHNDIKDSNILVDDNGKKMRTRLIDWGLSTTYIPFKHTPLPICWHNRPFQYNNPFSIIIFSPFFLDKYNVFLNNVNRRIDNDNIKEFLNKYIDFWMVERGPGHYALMCTIINILSNAQPKQYIIDYIADILLQFTNNGTLDYRHYLDTVFIHNVDKWGFVTSYFPMLHLYHSNSTVLDKTDIKCFNILKELFNYTYQSATRKIDTETITNYLHAFNSTLKLVSNNITTTNVVSEIKFTSPPKGITGKTIETIKKSRSTTRKRKNSK